MATSSIYTACPKTSDSIPVKRSSLLLHPLRISG